MMCIYVLCRSLRLRTIILGPAPSLYKERRRRSELSVQFSRVGSRSEEDARAEASAGSEDNKEVYERTTITPLDSPRGPKIHHIGAEPKHLVPRIPPIGHSNGSGVYSCPLLWQCILP
ncbi:hypothetical protein Y032_0577g224 [Ancylostoma ceylanicum]|uniref:Uncharacterized protein n=1 Tax=Ancylostoma ceylanicum TaxID=53326 RepID=A0A016WN11_9BILA|nr:hypothetical protein Y032_0577g224 [Ancylostoma ceylanicum]